MRERPILFSGQMVRAILDGNKTQTRRIVKPPPELKDGGLSWKGWEYFTAENMGASAHCPFGNPGDRLWVKETFFDTDNFRNTPIFAHRDRFIYRVDDEFIGCHHWKPSIHMPRCASRITLEIVSVRVERLQEISEHDAKAEGVEPAECCLAHYHGFSLLWQSIYTKPGQTWDDTPWVWVVEFKRLAA